MNNPNADSVSTLESGVATAAPESPVSASNDTAGNGPVFDPRKTDQGGKSRKSRKTPKSMKPKNADAALSTPVEIDLPTLVEKTAQRKAAAGKTFTAKKGKATLFAAVCAAVKSARSMDKTAHLDAKSVAEIESAIAKFWHSHAEKILNYGRIISATYDKPKAVFAKDGACTGLLLNAALRAERDPKDVQEERLFLSLTLKAANKRLDFMLDNLNRYTREDCNVQMTKINAIEKRIKTLESELPAPTAPAKK